MNATQLHTEHWICVFFFLERCVERFVKRTNLWLWVSICNIHIDWKTLPYLRIKVKHKSMKICEQENQPSKNHKKTGVLFSRCSLNLFKLCIIEWFLLPNYGRFQPKVKKKHTAKINSRDIIAFTNSSWHDHETIHNHKLT